MDWLKEKSQSIFIILLDYAALPLRRENPPGVSLRRYARTRVAVRGRVLGAPRCEWQCNPHCHSGVNVPGRYARRRVAVRDRGPGTLGGEWQCETRVRARSRASGSAGETATRARTCRDGTLKGEWQCYIHRSYWFSSPSTSCLKNVRFLLKFSVSARIFFPRAFAIALMTASKL